MFVKIDKMKNIFEVKFTVSSEDIDDLNHVNNVVYVKWMDEVAFHHWAFLTKNYPLPEYIWVVARHEIDYKGQAVLGDEIIAKTWVGETKGFTSERLIEFYKDSILVAKSKTVWAMLDAKSYKPTRIRENVLKVLQPNK
jgi:acyl-CoA thioester hydrolase